MKKTAKQLDFKSVLIGVLLSVLVLVLVGANKTPKNLGDIVVNSIKVMNKEGKVTGGFGNTEGGGSLKIFNKEGKLALKCPKKKPTMQPVSVVLILSPLLRKPVIMIFKRWNNAFN